MTRLSKDEKDQWNFACVHYAGCEFESNGWETRKLAAARGAQHEAEHDTGEAMPELKDFQLAEGSE